MSATRSLKGGDGRLTGLHLRRHLLVEANVTTLPAKCLVSRQQLRAWKVLGKCASPGHSDEQHLQHAISPVRDLATAWDASRSWTCSSCLADLPATLAPPLMHMAMQ